MKQQAMKFSQNQICRDQPAFCRDQFPKCIIRILMMLIAPAKERYPGAGVDEDAIGGAEFSGNAVSFRQRKSPRGSDQPAC